LLSPLLPFFKSFDAEVVGTFGVLTGSIGELVRDLEPKNLEGFSIGLSGLTFGVVSNLARPLATAPLGILTPDGAVVIPVVPLLLLLFRFGSLLLGAAVTEVTTAALASGIEAVAADSLDCFRDCRLLLALLLFELPIFTPLLKTLLTLSITLPLMILPMLARAAGCLAAAHTGFFRKTADDDDAGGGGPPVHVEDDDPEPGLGKVVASGALPPAEAPSVIQGSGFSLLPFNLSLSERTNFLLGDGAAEATDVDVVVGAATAEEAVAPPGDDACPDDEAADEDSFDELRLKPKECIRREISFEARSTTEGVLMLISAVRTDEEVHQESSLKGGVYTIRNTIHINLSIIILDEFRSIIIIELRRILVTFLSSSSSFFVSSTKIEAKDLLSRP